MLKDSKIALKVVLLRKREEKEERKEGKEGKRKKERLTFSEPVWEECGKEAREDGAPLPGGVHPLL